MDSKNIQQTFLTIRYLTLIGETLAQDLGGIDWDGEIDPKKIVKVIEACFDRVEHIAQYATEENSPPNSDWKRENLIKDVEWLLFAMQDNHTLFMKGVRRGRTRPSLELVEELLVDLKASKWSSIVM